MVWARNGVTGASFGQSDGGVGLTTAYAMPDAAAQSASIAAVPVDSSAALDMATKAMAQAAKAALESVEVLGKGRLCVQEEVPRQQLRALHGG